MENVIERKTYERLEMRIIQIETSSILAGSFPDEKDPGFGARSNSGWASEGEDNNN